MHLEHKRKANEKALITFILSRRICYTNTSMCMYISGFDRLVFSWNKIVIKKKRNYKPWYEDDIYSVYARFKWDMFGSSNLLGKLLRSWNTLFKVYKIVRYLYKAMHVFCCIIFTNKLIFHQLFLDLLINLNVWKFNLCTWRWNSSFVDIRSLETWSDSSKFSP